MPKKTQSNEPEIINVESKSTPKVPNYKLMIYPQSEKCSVFWKAEEMNIKTFIQYLDSLNPLSSTKFDASSDAVAKDIEQVNELVRDYPNIIIYETLLNELINLVTTKRLAGDYEFEKQAANLLIPNVIYQPNPEKSTDESTKDAPSKE